MAKRRIFTEKYRGDKRFIPLPRRVLESPEFSMLSPTETKLIIDMLSMCNGKNNGDLCITFSMMKERGWKSKSSLDKATKSLLEKKFILLTRKGRAISKYPNLYALSFFAIDECNGKLDEAIKTTIRPSDSWKEKKVIDIKQAQKNKRKSDAKKERMNAKTQLERNDLSEAEISFYHSQIERCDYVIQQA